MGDVGDKILEEVTKQGKQLAAIDERTKNTNSGLHDLRAETHTGLQELRSEVAEIKAGNWPCPRGAQHETRLDRIEQDDRDQWKKLNAMTPAPPEPGTVQLQPKSESNGNPFGFKLNVKNVSIIVAGTLLGIGMVILILAQAFGG